MWESRASLRRWLERRVTKGMFGERHIVRASHQLAYSQRRKPSSLFSEAVGGQTPTNSYNRVVATQYIYMGVDIVLHGKKPNRLLTNHFNWNFNLNSHHNSIFYDFGRS